MAIAFSTYVDRIDSDVKKKRAFFSNHGTTHVPSYEYQIVDGIKQLVNVGESDFDTEIQSHAAEADINNIISRFMNGDLSVLHESVGTFGDFTDCPTTYADLFDRVQKCENLFNGLPADIKDKFDNSYQKFWSEFGSDRFDSIFNEYNDSLNVKTSPNVEDITIEKEVSSDAE